MSRLAKHSLYLAAASEGQGGTSHNAKDSTMSQLSDVHAPKLPGSDYSFLGFLGPTKLIDVMTAKWSEGRLDWIWTWEIMSPGLLLVLGREHVI